MGHGQIFIIEPSDNDVALFTLACNRFMDRCDIFVANETPETTLLMELATTTSGIVYTENVQLLSDMLGLIKTHTQAQAVDTNFTKTPELLRLSWHYTETPAELLDSVSVPWAQQSLMGEYYIDIVREFALEFYNRQEDKDSDYSKFLLLQTKHPGMSPAHMYDSFHVTVGLWDCVETFVKQLNLAEDLRVNLWDFHKAYYEFAGYLPGHYQSIQRVLKHWYNANQDLYK